MRTRRLLRERLLPILLVAATAALTAPQIPLLAATLPTGFSETLVATGLQSPTAMQFAPDGRLFVAEQGGRLRVIKNGALLSAPFLTLTVSSVGERGLLGVAFDPDFTTNRFVYVYYTATTPAIHNRISRFTANGDVAVAGSEVVLLDLNNLSSATNHNGGALAFGPDGKLYAAVGENANGANAQSFGNLLGKMLRINKDGSIPTDNPFYGTASGQNRLIYSLGLRNPFTFAFNPVLSQMFINDVGQNTWEEINDGLPGANYGWPDTEGTTTDAQIRQPALQLQPQHERRLRDHRRRVLCARDAAVSDGVSERLLLRRLLRRLDSQARPRGRQQRRHIRDRHLVAGRLEGRRRRRLVLPRARRWRSRVPHFVCGEHAEHHDAADEPHRRAWRVGHVQRAGFRAGAAALSVAAQWHEHRRSHGAGLHLRCCRSGQRRPLPRHRQQRLRQRHEQRSDADRHLEPGALRHDHAARGRNALQRRNVISYAGTATDPEDGTLPASAFTWQVDFHHDTHSHPFIPATSGSRTGSFTVPTTGHTETNVWYRIYLTVRDSAGQTQTTFRDVLPRKVNLTIATEPAGLQLRLDAQPMATPLTFESVVGIVRNIEAPATQVSGGTTYEFVSWSDGGAAAHNVTTPAANTTYTATYRAVTGGGGNGLSVTYYNNMDFTGTTVTGVDPTVDFAWGAGSPAAAIANDTFSARWTGQVQAPVTGTYTFYTQSDDGVRLWVNNQQLVNNWTDHGSTENSGTIALTAGQRYDIRMEFYENGGDAVARLSWSSGASLPEGGRSHSEALRCGSAGQRHTRQLPAVRCSSAVRVSC